MSHEPSSDAAAAAILPDSSQETISSTSSANTTTDKQAEVYHILAVYQFVEPKLPPAELPRLQQALETALSPYGVRGSLLLAPEGINGTISYPKPPPSGNSDGDAVQQILQDRFPGLRIRRSYYSGHVFYRFKIKIKPEIVTLRPDGVDGRVQQQQCGTDSKTTQPPINNLCRDPTHQKGIYVSPGPDWNALLEDPDCLVVDARNDYEIRLGTFRNAQNPHTKVFSEFVPWMQDKVQTTTATKKIAMFCTGGIRCEKASAACLDMIQQHTTTDIPVYHLEGGILAYLDTVPPQESLFEGSCYVFDQRVAVGPGLEPVPHMTLCHACRAPLTLGEQDGHPDFKVGQQCTYCKTTPLTDKQHQRYQARQRQIQLAQSKGELHLHDPKEKVLRVLGQDGRHHEQQQHQQEQQQKQRHKQQYQDDNIILKQGHRHDDDDHDHHGNNHNTNTIVHYWTIHGHDYDLDDFVEQHPGGKEAILLGKGRDCTALFESYHPFTNLHRYVRAFSASTVFVCLPAYLFCASSSQIIFFLFSRSFQIMQAGASKVCRCPTPFRRRCFQPDQLEYRNGIRIGQWYGKHRRRCCSFFSRHCG